LAVELGIENNMAAVIEVEEEYLGSEGGFFGAMDGV
jgi:hypothetical protein